MEYSFADLSDFLHRVKSMRVILLDQCNYITQFFTLNDSIDHFHRSAGAFRIECCLPIPLFFQNFDQCSRFFENYDPHHHCTKSQSVFNPHAYKIASCKPGCVCQVTHQVGYILDDLADNDDPDEDLNETKQRRQQAFAFPDKDDSQCSEGYIQDSG